MTCLLFIAAALSIALPPDPYWTTNTYAWNVPPTPQPITGYYVSLETNGQANCATLFTPTNYITLILPGTNSYLLLAVFPTDGSRLYMTQQSCASEIMPLPMPYYDIYWMSSPAKLQTRATLAGTWTDLGTFNETNLTYSIYAGPMRFYRISPPQPLFIRQHY